MVFEIQKASRENAKEIAELLLSVSTSPRLILEFAACEREEWLQWYVQNVQCEIAACGRVGDEEAQALVAVDSEAAGRIAGFAVWSWSANVPNLLATSKSSIALPQGTHLPLRHSYASALDALEEKHRPEGRHYYLFDLATSPEYQRRGVASRLLGYGLEKADREGVKVYLSASPMGAVVYARLGFVEVGSLSVDLEEFGGGKGERHVHSKLKWKRLRRNIANQE
ncbi:acyl-CoA N-acyltransferase [Stipitochalara longipes BDJ]|nr:acyl-CoA N-acyltransferase [Stipitochalara longipes BDJ]